MNDDLANRIRKAYPNGLTESLDRSVLDSPERDERIRKVIAAVSQTCSLNATVDSAQGISYEISFTQDDHPHFEDWVVMPRDKKLDWIACNHGDPYPVFWLKISRIADYYYYFYNHWVPRGNTGYLDHDFIRQPNSIWKEHERRICDELDRNGFALLSDDLAGEQVDFVLDHDDFAIPENDPRRLDEKFTPPLIPTTIHDCLFSQ
ncbi:MAG: hypothetical protein KBC05_14845 [Candidatus Hydrogenedentes bacterium]|nr:hypothetical protein [Candidatus Hydrogenedentota bacterium]